MLNTSERRAVHMLIDADFNPVVRGVELRVGRLCNRLLEELDRARTEARSYAMELERERIRL